MKEIVLAGFGLWIVFIHLTVDPDHVPYSVHCLMKLLFRTVDLVWILHQ